jgi:hypothetical protein
MNVASIPSERCGACHHHHGLGPAGLDPGAASGLITATMLAAFTPPAGE